MDEVEDDADRLKQADARSYDATASEFDVLTDRYSTAIASRMLDIAGVGKGARLLDLGTGTGLLARIAAERGANVVGIDHSEGMLGRARAKAEAVGLADRTAFQAMDAEALQLEDGSFDVVATLYVLRHLPDPKAAVREMHRVLKPGGRLVAAVGARPSPLSASGVGAVADRFMAAMGRRALSPTYLRGVLDEQGVPPSRGHAAHHGNEDVGAMLTAAGFKQIRQDWWGERFLLSPEEFWDVQAVFDSEARERLTSLPDARVAELKQRFIDRCRTIAQRGVSLVYRTGAVIHSAER
jgi:ubiquinone/menaquinone biosynthesis C-methylase UbiE